MTRLLARLRAFHARQLYLWDRYGQRHDLTGRDTRAALQAAQLTPLRRTGEQPPGEASPPS